MRSDALPTDGGTRSGPGWSGRCAGILAVALGCAILAVPGASAATSHRCALVAHRGYHSSATENGMRALRRAVRLHADYLEVDVRVSKDDHLVLMHDVTVGRTTNGRGQVARKTGRRIHRLRLNDGGHVPYLRQALRLARNVDVRILVELKAMGTTASYQRLASLVERFGSSRVTVMSSHRVYLDQFRLFAPFVDEAVVTRRAPSAAEAARFGAVAVHHSAITDHWLATMDTARIRVFAWTVNTVPVWNRLSGAVDGIITDETPGYANYRRTASACHAA